jgi:hypothetical protein
MNYKALLCVIVGLSCMFASIVWGKSPSFVLVTFLSGILAGAGLGHYLIQLFDWLDS